MIKDVEPILFLISALYLYVVYAMLFLEAKGVDEQVSHPHCALILSNSWERTR
jgi:hypothetical protein